MNQQMDVKKTAQLMNDFARQTEMSAAKVRLCVDWIGLGCMIDRGPGRGGLALDKQDPASTSQFSNNHPPIFIYLHQEDMLNDALMDAFDGEEEEADEVVSSVLHELALDVGKQMADAPVGKLPARAEAAADSVSESEEDATALRALEQLLPPSGT